MTGWRRDIRDVFLLLDKVGGGAWFSSHLM